MKDLALPALHETRVWAQEHSELAVYGIDRVGLTRVHGAYNRTAQDADRQVGHLQIALRGKAEVLLATGWVTLPHNCPYVNPVGSTWGWRHAASASPLELLFVRLIPGKALSPLLRSRESTLLPKRDPEDLLWAFRRLYRESVAGGRSSVIQCLAELIAIYARDLLRSDNTTNFLADMWVRVMAEPQHEWTVKYLAECMKMSPERLRLLCHQETGRSPMQHVAQLRMQKAAQLLKEGDHSIEQISYLVGYHNPFGFSTAFRRRYGMSPSDFRRKFNLK